MSKQINKDKRLVTEQEVAGRLGIRPKTLARHRREGKASPLIKRARSCFYEEGRAMGLPITADEALDRGLLQIAGCTVEQAYTGACSDGVTQRAVDAATGVYLDSWEFKGHDRNWWYENHKFAIDMALRKCKEVLREGR